MVSLVPGRSFTVAVSLLLAALVVYYVWRAKHGHIPFIRKISGLDSIEEVIGRAVEMGRPVHLSSGGSARWGDEMVAQSLAMISVLKYVADLVVKYGARLIVSVLDSQSLPMVTETVTDSYKKKGLDVPVGTVRYYSEWPANNQALAATVLREKPGANIQIGPIGDDAIFLSESAAKVGAMQVSGTARTAWIPFLAVASDYVLIGEEVFVAGTYLSKDPIETGSIVAQDWGKVLALVLLAVAFLLSLSGSNWFANLFAM